MVSDHIINKALKHWYLWNTCMIRHYLILVVAFKKCWMQSSIHHPGKYAMHKSRVMHKYAEWSCLTADGTRRNGYGYLTVSWLSSLWSKYGQSPPPCFLQRKISLRLVIWMEQLGRAVWWCGSREENNPAVISAVERQTSSFDFTEYFSWHLSGTCTLRFPWPPVHDQKLYKILG